MIATESCWERGCACHDSRESTGVELVKKRQWVGLEIEEVQDSYNSDYQAQTRAVEKLLKERNHD